MENHRVHYEPVGDYAGNIFLDEHPNKEAQDIGDQMLRDHEENVRNFQDAADTLPNLNEKYAAEIVQVQEQFAQDGVKISPIVVLGEQEFNQLTQEANLNVNLETNGFYWRDRVIVREASEEVQEAYGKDFTLGVIAHEAAHSTAEDKGSLVMSRTVETTPENASEEEGRTFSTSHYREDLMGGFTRPKMEADGTVTQEGHFFEEAFADLKRVKIVEKLGREPRAEGQRAANKGVAYIGENSGGIYANTADEDTVLVPVKFANGARVGEGQWQALVSIPGIAAYGLDLLDKHAPGLFDKMTEARTNPKVYAEAAKMIDNIRPGLYRELRQLHYSEEDFKKGLKLIENAIVEKEQNKTGRVVKFMSRVLRRSDAVQLAA